MMMKIGRLTAIVVLFSFFEISAQSYRIYFTDKGSSSELLNNPYEYLSGDAIERKAQRGVVLDKSDLPVAPEYLKKLRRLDLELTMVSRWFNYAKVEKLIYPELVESLSFVKRIEKVRPMAVYFSDIPACAMADSLNYGIADNQIEMVNGDYLHDRDLKGQGMRIAVLDGGFQGSKGLPGLDSLWSSGRVKGTYNFVTNDTNIFSDGSHGTSVLGVLAGFIDSSYAGSAILADYYLFKTEVEVSETPAEMDNWLRAAERADSIGIDVITSSLGYNKFDGGDGDYDYEDMDGNTTLITKAADMAAKKGVLVVVSAGNEGNDSWEKITAPADGDSVLSVGAVLPDGTYASFSSTGPTSDGRIKPDVMAQGLATAIINNSGPTFGNGTSFSCPIISGLAACLWQTDLSLTNMQVFEAIRSNASQAFTPDNQLGFGIADFQGASWSLGKEELETDQFVIDIYPNPVNSDFSLEISGLNGPEKTECVIYDMSGRPLVSKKVKVENDIPVSLPAPSEKGAYLLSIKIGERSYLRKIVK